MNIIMNIITIITFIIIVIKTSVPPPCIFFQASRVSRWWSVAIPSCRLPREPFLPAARKRAANHHQQQEQQQEQQQQQQQQQHTEPTEPYGTSFKRKNMLLLSLPLSGQPMKIMTF